MRKGDILELVVERLALGGQGLSSYEGMKIFVPRGIPGQRLKVRIKKQKKQYAEAQVLEVLQTSNTEITAKCPYFASSKRINEKQKNCGGCLWQHMSYADQLSVKENLVKETLQHLGKFKDVPIHPILGSPDEWFYRNKIELSFSQHPETEAVDFGFRQLGMYREVVPIEECVIFDPELPPVLDAIRRFVRMHNWPVFDFQKRPEGFWQYLIIRRGVNTGEWMIHFITRPGYEIHRQLVQELKDILGEKLQSVLHTVNFGKAISYSGHENKKTQVLFGRDYILEQIGDLQFTISPFSFFQTNTAGAKVLYDAIAKAANLSGKEKVLDVFCGTGTIGQYLARKAREVIGIEVLEEAVRDAEVNARHNTLPSCSYIAGDATKVLHFQARKFLNTDVVIMDPPRAGLPKKALMSILKLAAPKIIYVSCNPATLARDLTEIVAKRYKVTSIQPVDMFPHTGHVESVVVLDRIMV